MRRRATRASAARLALLGAVLPGLALPLLAGVPGPASAAPPTTRAAAPAPGTVPQPTTVPQPSTGPQPSTVPEPDADDDALPAEVTLTAVTPQVAAPGQDLVLTGTIRNTGDTPITQPRLVVRLDRSTYISRSSLDRWRSASPDSGAGTAIFTLDLTTPVPPGGTVPVDVVVPANALALRTTWAAWGPRGLALEVVDKADPARARQGLARTFLLWYPVDEVTATRVTVLVPFVGPAVDPHTDAWVEDLEELTVADGRLADVLSAASGEVTWAVDPWLVEAAGPSDQDEATRDEGSDDESSDTTEGTGEGTAAEEEPSASPSPSPTSATDEPTDPADDVATAGPSSRAWTRTFLQRMTDRDVQLLPYGDADVAALAHADRSDLLDQVLARARSLAATTDLPDSATTSVVWPAETLPDRETVLAAAAGQGRAVVVGPGELLPPDDLTYTPSSRATLGTDQGDVPLLVADERLSVALSTGRPAGAEGDDDVADVAQTPATAAQDLLAELAVLTRERPSDARHLLVTVPRTWDPDPEVAAAQVEALTSAPWTRGEPLSALVGLPDPGIVRGSLPERDAHPAEVSRAQLDTVQQAVDTRADLAQMGEDPAALLGGDVERETALPTSVAWRTDPDGRQATVLRSVAVTEDLRTSVAVQPGSDINLIATTGELPVRVANDLDQDVTVEVALVPGDARLRPDAPQTVTVPAGEEVTTTVPVHAIQSADVAVTVELRTPEGVLIDDSTVVTVRVRAEWEGIGAAVVGGVLLVLVVIGLVRTVRRGRTPRRAQPQTEAGPDALSPEEAEEVTHER